MGAVIPNSLLNWLRAASNYEEMRKILVSQGNTSYPREHLSVTFHSISVWSDGKCHVLSFCVIPHWFPLVISSYTFEKRGLHDYLIVLFHSDFISL